MAEANIDYYKEKEKFIMCIAASVAALLSGILFNAESRFYAQYYERLGLYKFNQGPGVYICMIGFLLLGLGLLLLSGSASRGRKLIALKEAAVSSEKTQVRRGYVSVGAVSEKSREYDSFKKKSNIVRLLSMCLVAVSAVCFTVCFCAYDVVSAVKELGRADIERTMSDFRVLANLFGKLFAYGGIGISSVCCVNIMSNRTVKKPLMYISIACLAVAAVQLAYFFVGDIWTFPCVADLAVVILECVLTGLCIMSLVTERIKSDLKSFGNNVEAEY